MAPLKSLEPEFSAIDSHFQMFCVSLGIFTEDFLLYDLHKLTGFAEQKPNSERLKQGITQLLSVVDGLHKPWMNGMDLLEDAKQNKHILSTGCEGIDMLLGGGLREGQLTEIVGPSSSGKTQVCLQAASSVAKKHMGSVVYIDTCNSFSPQRVASFVGLVSNLPFDQGAKHKILQNVMSNILCHSVFDIFAMFGVLHQLEFKLRSQKGDNQVQLLIVDSISSLITPILGGSGLHGHALMLSVGYLLKKLAHEHNIAILVTNHTVGGEGGIPKPALGETWKSIPHVRLLLSRDRGNNICSVSIIKHSSMASGKAASFMIYG
ncbi:DNA repair protein RAD51 homolog 4 isoform X2 [Ziziphus jujuba]|uniref:DNA repair protein RAD51 homolog 4 isoform X2 n=1 Tax=Ziziphus jujuba TaxID=326968 RepID=A0ABM3I9D4_ZIZJJ|nr:DNA repair protein RAD51 homolog 4 isoform X2 [Ziziphus jujuba]